MLYLHSLRGRAGEYIQDNNSIEKTMLAKKTLAAALQENKEVVGGLIPVATFDVKGKNDTKGGVNMIYNNSSKDVFLLVADFSNTSASSINILCSVKHVMINHYLGIINAYIHPNAENVFSTRLTNIEPFYKPNFYLDKSNKKIYLKIPSYSQASFIILNKIPNDSDTIAFQKGIYVDSVEGMEEI